MTDVVGAATRSRMMSGIKGKNTQPEMAVRRYLHASGYRFRLHRKDLPGQPDLVLPKYKLVIFIHGCFWHRHAGCFYATSPVSRKEFWQEKLTKNVERDQRQIEQLNDMGWRVLIIWECGLKHAGLESGELKNLINSNSDLVAWPSAPPRLRV